MATAEQRAYEVLQKVCKVHGLSEDDILGDDLYLEIARARHQFRIKASEGLGAREAARVLGCSPGTISYVRKIHAQNMKSSFIYRETFNELEKL